MDIVTSVVRVLVLTFVLVGGAITFAGPQTVKDNTDQDLLNPATVLNAPDQDQAPTESATSSDPGVQDVG